MRRGASSISTAVASRSSPAVATCADAGRRREDGASPWPARSRGRAQANICILSNSRAGRCADVARRSASVSALRAPCLSASMLRSCSCTAWRNRAIRCRYFSASDCSSGSGGRRTVVVTRCAHRRAASPRAASSSLRTLRRRSSRAFCVSGSTRGNPARRGRALSVSAARSRRRRAPRESGTLRERARCPSPVTHLRERADRATLPTTVTRATFCWRPRRERAERCAHGARQDHASARTDRAPAGSVTRRAPSRRSVSTGSAKQRGGL